MGVFLEKLRMMNIRAMYPTGTRSFLQKLVLLEYDENLVDSKHFTSVVDPRTVFTA